MSELLCCPYCGNPAEYKQNVIYCKKCPLRAEHKDMSFNVLAEVWNGLPRTRPDDVIRKIIEDAYQAGQADDPSCSNARAYCDRLFPSI